MRRAAAAVVLLSLGGASLIATARGGDWTQFRGPNASGHAVATGKLPAEIGPSSHIVWKVPLPPGHASPVVFGDRIFLNAVENEKLLVMALDRGTGKTLWKAEVPHDRLEEIHRIGSHAQCTPAVDGERVLSFFGSAGLFCHDLDGNLLWKRPMGPFKNTFGAGSSPLIVDDWVILCQDHDTDSFLAAIDKRTGETVWQADRSEFPRNYSTPVIWSVGGKKQVVVAATLRVVGYDLATGRELWTARGIARFVSATPVIGDDNVLYVAGWAAGGDDGGIKFDVPPFDDVVGEYDKNKNGTLEEDELPEGGPIRMRFVQVDRDKSGGLTREEYDYFRKLFQIGRNIVIAVKPGGLGDVSATHVLWTYAKHVPFCASPVVVGDRLFSVKDGGIVSCLAAHTGKPYKQGRLEAIGDYYSSPVAGDGKIYLLNEEGRLTVISSESDWQVLHTADFGENTYATPAIVDGKIFLRTMGHLYCFSADSGTSGK
ncbi:MAG: PQQ-binding-like beta-propeller repeat protein [Planctomycetia bacterium]|nr:PQQ-binding-like beta-propeller repeat protein [Planctomycetia bacterium]